MIDINIKILNDIKLHAEKEYPREACGVVIVQKGRHRYIPCTNISTSGTQFAISAEDYATAEDLGEVVLIVHSHPDISPLPSEADLVECEKTQLPWLILSWPLGTHHIFYPSGYVAPLVGRQFTPGILDCYTLIKDFYAKELDIHLAHYPREEQWWNLGKDLYMENICKEGFTRVYDEKKYDIHLMAINSNVPNHGAICLGDGTIIHHQAGRLSSIDVYGGWYRKVTTHTFRHRSQM